MGRSFASAGLSISYLLPTQALSCLRLPPPTPDMCLLIIPFLSYNLSFASILPHPPILQIVPVFFPSLVMMFYLVGALRCSACSILDKRFLLLSSLPIVLFGTQVIFLSLSSSFL